MIIVIMIMIFRRRRTLDEKLVKRDAPSANFVLFIHLDDAIWRASA